MGIATGDNELQALPFAFSVRLVIDHYPLAVFMHAASDEQFENGLLELIATMNLTMSMSTAWPTITPKAPSMPSVPYALTSRRRRYP